MLTYRNSQKEKRTLTFSQVASQGHRLKTETKLKDHSHDENKYKQTKHFKTNAFDCFHNRGTSVHKSICLCTSQASG